MYFINKKLLAVLAISSASLVAGNAAPLPSILDIKHSITDNNIVPPESFETKTRELEENFYLQNYVVPDNRQTGEKLGTAKEYEKRLASLPTEIEMPYNDIVGRFINMYLGKRRGLVSDMLALHSYYGNIFLEELLKEGMPTELQYLPVIESAINPNAVSRAGAVGLWQFMPATAKGLGMEINSLVDERRDPRISSRNAARYLHQLYDIYGDWSLAIAAYNCGPGNVNKALRRAGGGKKDFWEIYNYLPSETRGYVPAFIAANYVMNFYGKHNIAPTVVRRQLITDTIKVNKRIHFNQIAEVLNIPVEEIRMLNPQFRKDIIPGNFRAYMLTLPKQQCLSFLMSEESILAHDADLYAQRTFVEPGVENAPEIIDENGTRNLTAAGRQSENASVNMELAALTGAGAVSKVTHVVGRGESIKNIAKQYGVSATDIKRWNKLRRGKVKEGDRLIIETRKNVDPDNVRAVASKQKAQSEVPMPPKKQAAPAAAVPPARKQATAGRNGSSERVTDNEDTRAGRRYAHAAENDVAGEKATSASKTKKVKSQAVSENTSGNKTADKNNRATKKNKGKQSKQRKPKVTNYTVKNGDNLERIARKNGTTVEELRKANGMKANESMIHEGETLKIPGKAKAVKNSKGKKSKGKSGSRKKKRR